MEEIIEYEGTAAAKRLFPFTAVQSSRNVYYPFRQILSLPQPFFEKAHNI